MDKFEEFCKYISMLPRINTAYVYRDMELQEGILATAQAVRHCGDSVEEVTEKLTNTFMNQYQPNRTYIRLMPELSIDTYNGEVQVYMRFAVIPNRL